MKVLLRSVFQASGSDNPELLLKNCSLLMSSGLGFDLQTDITVWQYIQDFVSKYHHVPDLVTLRSYFEHTGEVEVVDRLEVLATSKPRTQGNFLQYLEQKVEDRRKRQVAELLTESHNILTTGISIKQGKKEEHLKGPRDAVNYILDRSRDIVAPATGGKLSGNVTADGADFLQEYQRVKNDPLAGKGQLTGITQIDESLGGAKRGELWTHAAFTGGLKSTFILNWVYNQAIAGESSLVFSLEMPYNQCRRILYVMHSLNPDVQRRFFERFGFPLNPIAYQPVRDGELGITTGGVRDPDLERRLELMLEFVVRDFTDPENQYGSIHIEVADPDKSDFTVADLRSKSELIYSNDPFSMIVVDHMGLMSPRKWVASTTERLNEVVRDLKRLAMSFNRGAGIAMVGLFQISREGYKAAEKSEGKYNLTHLSYANECLPGNCLIAGSMGLVRLDSIRVGDKVWSRSGWKPVLEVFDQGVRRLWKVTTNRGAVFEATASHRVRVLVDEEITWKEVQHLTAEDWLLSTRGSYPWPGHTQLPQLEGERRHLTSDLAYLLGAWDGDGKVRPYVVAFTGNRKEVALRRRLANTLSRVFGQEPFEYDSPSRPGSFELEMPGDQKINKIWFEGISGPRGEEVPPVILRASRSLVLDYLRGLFDTDGWINNQNVVGIKMKSEAFLRQIQQVMTLLGYDTNLSRSLDTLEKTGNTYESWTLRLIGLDSRVKFAQEIGFTEPWKAERLANSVRCPGKDKRTYPVGRMFAGLAADYTPYRLVTEGIIRRSHFNVVATARQTGLVPHGAIEYLLRFLDEAGISDSRAEFLRELIQLQIARPVEVMDTGRDEQVWDIEVTGDHEYQSGPFLSHNCERSSDIVTATWIDDDLRRDNQVRFMCLKSRDQQPFESFFAHVEWAQRRISTLNDPSLKDAKKHGDEIDELDLDLELL